MRASSPRYRRYLLVACGGLLVFFGARWALLRGKPERLRDLPADSHIPLGIRKGVAYFRTEYQTGFKDLKMIDEFGQVHTTSFAAPNPFVIRALPVMGGPGRIIGEDRRPKTVYRLLQFAENSIYYLAYPENPTDALSVPITVPETHKRITTRLPLAQASVYTLPLAGGSPVHLLPGPPLTIATSRDNADLAVCVLGEKVYWIEIAKETRTPQSSGRLRVASKNGGEPKTLLTRLSPYTTLFTTPGASDAVWIFVPGADNHKRGDIYHLGISEDKPHLFLTGQENPAAGFARELCFVAWSGRIYWKHSTYTTGRFISQLQRTEILSAAPDGSDQRLLHTFPGPQSVSSLYAYAGSLYLDLYNSGGSASKRSGHVLMRLKPGSSAALQEVLRFPPKVSSVADFDGDSLYYVLDEEREKFFDWSPEGLRPILAHVLYRYRLPD